MESWEELAVNQNLGELQRLTICYPSFLAKLIQLGILNDNDVDVLKTLGDSKGRFAQSFHLYEIVKTRKGAFHAVIETLRETNQTGAYHIFEVATANKEKYITQSKTDVIANRDELTRWQVKHIQENYTQLWKNTNGSDLLLAELSLCLTHENEIALAAEKDSKAKSRLLYRMVPEKKGMYESLTRALLETSQYFAFKVLMRGFLEHGVNEIFKFCNISERHKNLPEALKGLEKFVLQYPVTFQGHVVSLKNILKGVHKDVVESIAEESLNGALLVQILNNNAPVLIFNSVPEPLKYYISRRLTARNHIDPKLFEDHSNDIFVFKGIQPYKLSELAGKQDTALSSEQISKLSVRFILLEVEEDFDNICKISEENPVHLLSYNDGQITWIKTHGSISTLLKYVRDLENLNATKITEDEFLNLCCQTTQPVCVFDTPGMGKTVLLINIADQIRKKEWNKLVCFIVLREFVPNVEKRRKWEIDTTLVINTIADLVSETGFGKKIVKTLFQSETQIVELFFDGLDEVLFSQVNNAKQILKIVSSLKSVKMYVSTRPHMRHELETTLGALGYNIMPFGEDEQIEFLTKYWKQHGAKCDQRLDEFSKTCLITLKRTMNNFERDIAGIPLQCALLAEVYQEEAIRYSNPEKRVVNFDLGVVIRITSLFDIYKKLLEMRLRKLTTLDKRSFWTSIAHKIWNIFDPTWRVKILTRMHMYNALHLLFPSHAKKFESCLTTNFNSMERHYVYSLGILENKKIDDQLPRFVHRTYAEYFFALLVARTWTAHDDLSVTDEFRNSFTEFVFSTILLTTKSKQPVLKTLGKSEIVSYTFQHPVICYFINFQLQDKQTKVEISANITSERLYQVLAACIYHDYSKIYEEISKSEAYKKLLNSNQRIHDLAYLSVKYSSDHHGKKIYQNFLRHFFTRELYFQFSSILSGFVISPLHVAAERGNLAITTFLLHLISPVELKELQYVVHCCVAQTNEESQAIITQKEQILKLLFNKNADWFNEPLPNGTTPLLQANIHLTLVESLLELGADVNVVTEDGCVLHRLAGNKISPQIYHDSLLLYERTGFNKFYTLDSKKSTSLHAAVKNIELLEETLRMYYLQRADFNAVDEPGESILFSALRKCRSLNLVQALISFEANVNYTNCKNENAFHICAIYGNLKAFEYLMEYDNLSLSKLNTKNNDGLTPFIQGVSHGKGFNTRVMELLEIKGYNTEEIASKALKRLICNKNITEWELNDQFVETADYLIKRGGKVICKDGQSPWQLEATLKNKENIEMATQTTKPLLRELSKRGILIDHEKYLDNSKLLINHLQVSTQHTFEHFCISLICCQQTNPFLLLKQCLQSDAQDSVIFLTPPSGLVEFIQTTHDYLVILRSTDIELSIKRITDTIDPDALTINEEDLTNFSNSDLTIFKCETVTTKIVERLVALEIKVIIVCINVQLQETEHTVLNDSFGCEDLSEIFRQELLSFKKFGDDEIAVSDSQDISLLKNEHLVEFIRENLPSFIEPEGEHDNFTYLSDTIFHYFIPDKLVFQNISRSQLDKFATFGQTIGEDTENLESLDYLIVKSEAEFDHICKKFKNAHLIEICKDGRFKLVKTWGSDNEIKKFYVGKPQNKVCENFPFCICGNHPIGSGNLIWSVFKFPYKKAKHCINILQLFQETQLTNFTLGKSVARIEITELFATTWQNVNNNCTLNWKRAKKFIEKYKLSTLPTHTLDVVTSLLNYVKNEDSDCELLQQIAVITLFPKLVSNSTDMIGLEKYVQLGVLKTYNNSFVFVHNSLAWYFIARWLLINQPVQFLDVSELLSELFRDCFESQEIEVKYTWWKNSYLTSGKIGSYRFHEKLLFEFIEGLLDTTKSKLFESHLKQNMSISSFAEKWIHACIYANHVKLLKIMVDLEVDKKVFNSEQVIFAIKFSQVPIINLVIEYYQQQSNKSVTDIRIQFKSDKWEQHNHEINILHIAILRGNYTVMRCLLNNHKFKDILNYSDMWPMLSFCVWDTQTCHEQIYERKRIIGELLQSYPNCINQKSLNGETQLFAKSIHIDLVLHFIRLGMDVHATDENYANILHFYPECMTPQDYDKLVRTLNDRGDSVIFRVQNTWRRIALHVAVQYLELLDSTLEIFSSAKVDFNAVDDDNYSVLHFAVIFKRSARLLDSLIRAGSDINKKDRNNTTVLHYSAEVGNLTALRYFISRGCNVNEIDVNKFTPLHIALRVSKLHTHETVQILVQHGADVNAIDVVQRSPLSYALERSVKGEVEMETVELLKKVGAK